MDNTLMYGPRMYFGPADNDTWPRMYFGPCDPRNRKHSDLTRCYFCEEKFLMEPGSSPEDELYAEEVGEFWNETLQDSVLAHPDCLPMGIEATLSGEDPEWKMA